LDSNKYYYYQKELQKWKDKKFNQGANYVIDQYINKYEAILEEYSREPENPKLKLDPPKTNKQMNIEYNDKIKRRVKSLKRKIDGGNYGWQDLFLFDVYSGKPKEEWRLPL